MQAFGEYANDGTASAMKARDYKDATDLVASPVIIDRAAFNQGENAQYKPRIEHGDTMDSLVARGPHAVAIPIHDQATRNAGKRGDKQDGKGNGLGVGKPGDPAPTLTKGDKHAVLYENHPNDSRVTGPYDVAPSCVSRYGTGGGNVPLVQEPVAVDCYNKTIGDKSQSISSSASDVNHTGGVINPADRMAVRRLSPRECERLQGFPDDHTLIPWRNKPADQCPDGPRYKALGNSMAVPCMAWIGKRIDVVEKNK
jgi:DNA (cytosine-5)-methyltransferase 1